MRISASLLLKNGYCYQSYRWQFLRPLGSLHNAIKILEERKVDEISIIRYCRGEDDVNSLDYDLDLISNIDCTTPLSFGGGIRDVSILQKIHQLPVERILLSSAYLDKDQMIIEKAIELFGKQALIAVLPYRYSKNNFEYFHCRLNAFCDCDMSFIDKYSNEVMFYNTTLECYNHSAHFDSYNLPLPNSKIILSGGVNRAFIRKVRNLDFAAICFDNTFLHHEFCFSEL
jgi:imidazole glycerol phosphate synthase subunit HisF